MAELKLGPPNFRIEGSSGHLAKALADVVDEEDLMTEFKQLRPCGEGRANWGDIIPL